MSCIPAYSVTGVYPAIPADPVPNHSYRPRALSVTHGYSGRPHYDSHDISTSEI
jgi:hypothetical protein